MLAEGLSAASESHDSPPLLFVPPSPQGNRRAGPLFSRPAIVLFPRNFGAHDDGSNEGCRHSLAKRIRGHFREAAKRLSRRLTAPAVSSIAVRSPQCSSSASMVISPERSLREEIGVSRHERARACVACGETLLAHKQDRLGPAGARSWRSYRWKREPVARRSVAVLTVGRREAGRGR